MRAKFGGGWKNG